MNVWINLCCLLNSKRRSKSLDDIIISKDNKDPLTCYKNSSTPISPVIAFDSLEEQSKKLKLIAPKRRHSLSASLSGNNTKDYSTRLATIYGWVTTTTPIEE